jgi:peptide/histidine transporter 3/4
LFSAIEFSERLSYFGIATSLVLYLTKVMHQDLKTAARNVNYWSGVTTLMPLFGGLIADAYLGRYSTVFASSIVYLMVSSITMPLQLH